MKYILNIYSISALIWIFFVYIFISSGNDNPIQNPYLLKSSYDSFSEVLDQLSIIDYKTDLFEWCCDCINFISKSFGYTYQEMNIILFVYFLPGVILNLIIILSVQLIQIKLLRRCSR